MVESKEKQKYGGLMTEHERRVNDDDLRAFEQQKPTISGKLPGFGGGHEVLRQQRLIEGALGNKSPAHYSSKADVVIEPISL